MWRIDICNNVVCLIWHKGKGWINVWCEWQRVEHQTVWTLIIIRLLKSLSDTSWVWQTNRHQTLLWHQTSRHVIISLTEELRWNHTTVSEALYSGIFTITHCSSLVYSTHTNAKTWRQSTPETCERLTYKRSDSHLVFQLKTSTFPSNKTHSILKNWRIWSCLQRMYLKWKRCFLPQWIIVERQFAKVNIQDKKNALARRIKLSDDINWSFEFFIVRCSRYNEVLTLLLLTRNTNDRTI